MDGQSRTISPPRLLLVLHDNLPQPRGEAMVVVVHHGLADVQGSLADEVLEFLPATVRWDLSFSAWDFRSGQKRGFLTPWRKRTNSSSDAPLVLGRALSRAGMVGSSVR